MTEEIRSPGVRHRFADRLFHWVMAISVIVLGATSFLPIIGIKFDWLPIHWITGVVLTISILFHLYRVCVVHGLSGMAPGIDDLREAARSVLGGGNGGLKPAQVRRVPERLSLGSFAYDPGDCGYWSADVGQDRHVVLATRSVDFDGQHLGHGLCASRRRVDADLVPGHTACLFRTAARASSVSVIDAARTRSGAF